MITENLLMRAMSLTPKTTSGRGNKLNNHSSYVTRNMELHNNLMK